MTRKLAAAAALTAAALAPASALASPAAADPTRPPLPKVTGAYFYVDHNGKAGDYAHIVFRTAAPIARGSQNSLQAGVEVEGVGHSVGTVDRAHNLYGAFIPIKGHSIPARRADGTPARKGTRLGRVFRIVVEGRDGTRVARTVRLRAERRGDDAGRPLTR